MFPESLLDFHHAYLIEGDEIKRAVIEKELSQKGFDTVGNPDYFYLEEHPLSIGEVRRILEFEVERPVQYEKKVILLYFDRANVEAQNALLKVLEEPHKSSTFILLTPFVHDLIPTLISRLNYVSTKRETPSTESVLHFLSLMPSTRLEYIESVISERKVARDFVRNLLDARKSIPELQESTNLKRLLEVEQYLSQRSASVKQCIEFLSLTLPRIK